MNEKLSWLIRMVLPSVMLVLSGLVEALKNITPSYVDDVINWVWKEFIGDIVEIQTDNDKDNTGQIKTLWLNKREGFIFVMLKSGNEAGLDWANEKLNKFPKLQFALVEYFSFGMRLAERLKNGEITEEASEELSVELETMKKKFS